MSLDSPGTRYDLMLSAEQENDHPRSSEPRAADGPFDTTAHPPIRYREAANSTPKHTFVEIPLRQGLNVQRPLKEYPW